MKLLCSYYYIYCVEFDIDRGFTSLNEGSVMGVHYMALLYMLPNRICVNHITINYPHPQENTLTGYARLYTLCKTLRVIRGWYTSGRHLLQQTEE
jgi:hypothetical protein